MSILRRKSAALNRNTGMFAKVGASKPVEKQPATEPTDSTLEDKPMLTENIERTTQAATLGKLLSEAINAGNQTRAEVCLDMIAEGDLAGLLYPEGSVTPYVNQLDLVNDVDRAFRERAEASQAAEQDADDRDDDQE